MSVADVYFKVLNEMGRVYATSEDFLNVFVKECEKRKIKVTVYKERGFYKIEKVGDSN